MNKALAALGAALVLVITRGVLDLGLVTSVIVAGFTYTGISAIEGEWPQRLKARLEDRRSQRLARQNARGGPRGRRGRHLPGAGSGTASPPSYLDGLASELEALGISREDFDEALTTGSRKLVQLRKVVARVGDARIRAKANGVCDAAARILSEIRQDPADLRKARNFLDYYLDATVKVVDRYVSLSGRPIRTPEMDSSLKRAEESLDTIRSAYDKQLAQLLENDVMDLDVELSVLERTIKMEGLGD